MMRKCPVCEKGELVPVSDIVSEIEGYTFVEVGERCNSCGEEFIPEEVAQKTIDAARRLGVWPEPLKLYRKLSKSGRATVLRIPSDLEEQLGIKGDERVAISKIGERKFVVEITE